MIRGIGATVLLGFSLFIVGCQSDVPEGVRIKSSDPATVAEQMKTSIEKVHENKAREGNATQPIAEDATEKGASAVGVGKTE